jgi:hypothetical protein
MLSKALRSGELRQYRPLRPSMAVRALYITPVVEGLLRDGRQEGFPSVEAETILARFFLGHSIWVTFESAKDCDLERLEDLDEIWAFCFRRPKPGWRLLGRFLAHNIFIGLNAYDRHQLGTAARYGHIATSAVTDRWKSIFGKTEPYRGNATRDYMGGVIYDDQDLQNDP